ncbi:hypothetical protein M569_07894, partial [Genlisea aurea]
DENDEVEGLFDETFKQLRKWVDVKSARYGTISVFREMYDGRFGTALKLLNDVMDSDGNHPPKKKLHDLKLYLLKEVAGWEHLVAYEEQWMAVKFPPSLPLF